MKPKSTIPADDQFKLRPEDVAGASRLLVQGVIGITDVVEAMHGTISRALPPLSRHRPQRTRGLSRQIYASVRGVTRAVGFGLETAARLLPGIPLEGVNQSRRQALISSLNGVVGDHLHATGNSLALTMSLRQHGKPLLNLTGQLGELPVNPQPIILVHGLCMNDRQWTREDHDHGQALAQDLGIAPLYLRYNTGRRISESGRELADLLQSMSDQWPVEIEALTLVGHSMGGLVIRSACLQAKALGHGWVNQLGTAVFLGTPHQGAPLERIGNLSSRLLQASPYSAPFARLSQLRSAGIRDLRHGNLLESDWKQTRSEVIGDHRQMEQMPAHVSTHAIAASRSPAGAGRIKGDGLVTVASALGRHRDTNRQLEIPEGNRHLIFDANHFDLLRSPTAYQTLKHCIANR
ncbi:MAG: alpha/beta hydrolase [Pseudomonadota bacterium]